MRAVLWICVGLAATLAVEAAKPADVGKDAAAQRKAERMAGGEKINGNGMEKGETKSDKNGNKHTRFQQTFDGYRVLGYGVNIDDIEARTFTPEDKGTRQPTGKKVKVKKQKKIHGKIAEDVGADLAGDSPANIDTAACVTAAKAKAKGHVRKERAEAVVFAPPGGGKAKAACLVELTVDDETDGPSMPVEVTDSAGNLLFAFDNLQTGKVGTGPGGNPKIGSYSYGTEKPKLDLTESGSTCSFLNTFVKTINLGGSTDRSMSTPHSFPCYNQAADAVNGGNSAINDAHYFGGVIFDMFAEYYSMEPLDFKPVLMKHPSNTTLRITKSSRDTSRLFPVHYGSNYENAFWDGSSMTFGDGYSYFYPLTSLDVVAHEVAHGFTQQKSNLIYAKESGGMNEAFSDMVGKATESYSRGFSSSFNWGIGYDIIKGSGALRYMNNPPQDSRSIDHVDNYYDGLDVHYSSGIFNKAFWHMATNFPYNTWDALDVFLYANVHYWASGSTFLQGAEGVMQVIDDLRAGEYNNFYYGHMDPQVAVDAWNGVGISCTKSAATWTCT